jgi:hypothetical protein
MAAFKTDVLSKTLELEEGEHVFTITPLGYPKEGFEKRGTKQRKELHQMVQFL